jgi:amidase
MNDVALLDATAQAQLVRNNQVKPIELIETVIERIERVNPRLNAVITPMYDEARKAASGPIPDGPFAGVPFLMKDLGPEYAGVRHTAGSTFLKDFVPPEDTELTKRHRRAGLITLGKTNTPEFGLLPTTEPQLLGPSRNPWNTDHTTGGSSGGSAAAVAAGVLPMAHGNDGGGSIRIPASCCGLFGLKTTRGRVPHAAIASDLSQDHALTRSVRDSAALLDATAGPQLGAPYWAPAPTRPFADEVGADPGALRIAFMAEAPTGVPLHPDCVAAVRDAASLCEELGHHVEEAAPPVDGQDFIQTFTTLWSVGAAATIAGWALRTGTTPKQHQFETLTWALAEQGRGQSGLAYVQAQANLQVLSLAIARFMENYDLILTPTLGEPPLPIGSFDSPPDNPMLGFARAATFVPFTPIANSTGQPAMSVPLFWNEANLPVGSHFIARFGDEATLIRLAAQLEEARPWAQRRPLVTA